jgi:hypothetical protein
LKLLSGHNAILHPQFCGEDDLTFAGNLSFHGGKILSYLSIVKYC